jgi:hypothetical protein
MLAFIVAIAGTVALHAPAPSACHFQKVARLWQGGCGRIFGQEPKMTISPAKTISSGRWRRNLTPSAVWAGEMTDEGQSNAAIELELYPGGTGVLRTIYGWYPVRGFTQAADKLAFELRADSTVLAFELDRDIVRRAAALLSSTSVWNRADNRVCPRSAKTLSIYCAMERASIEVTGGSHHRRPAMEVVRQLVDERSAGRNYNHRLMDYNNDPSTTFADVQQIFADALARINGMPVATAQPQSGAVSTEQPAFTATDLRIIDRAQEILGSVERWNRNDARTCPAAASTFSIYCALEKATEDVSGRFDDHGAVMREARAVVDFVAAKKYSSRLIDYNNDPTTSFVDVQAFFHILHNRVSRPKN